MDVSGKRTEPEYGDKDFYKGSEDVPSLLCYPCLQEGSSIAADGYCEDCGHHLCTGCYGIHCRPLPTRRHRLLDKEHMPTESRDTEIPEVAILDKCLKHANELLQFYCEGHTLLVCSVCLVLEHRMCTVTHVPSESKSVVDSAEYKAFKKKLLDLTTRVTDNKINAVANVKSAKQEADKALCEIKKIRKQINNVLDNMEKDVTQNVTQTQCRDDKIMADITRECEDLLDELHSITDDINDKEARDQTCRLYLQLKQESSKLRLLEDSVLAIDRRNMVRRYTFIKSDYVTDLMNSTNKTFGKLVFTPVRINELSNDKLSVLNAKAPIDKYTPRVAGLVVLSNRKCVVLTDWTNRSVKVIDSTDSGVVGQIKLKDEPWGITSTSQNEVAVIQPNSSVIKVLNIGEIISLTREIEVGQWCYGICYAGNKLIVSFMSSFHASTMSGNYVRIIDMQGTILKTFVTDDNGVVLFKTPLFVAVSPDVSMIYVADMNANRLICMKWDGRQEAIYMDETLRSPEGVAIADDGTVYVCSYGSDEIHALTPDLRNKFVLSTESIRRPEALAWSSRECRLYVGTADSDSVKVLSGI